LSRLWGSHCCRTASKAGRRSRSMARKCSARVRASLAIDAAALGEHELVERVHQRLRLRPDGEIERVRHARPRNDSSRGLSGPQSLITHRNTEPPRARSVSIRRR
jgi:hypothetical protein